ncbi:ArnT family glycosyltransferase [Salinicola rhizosphaerae]|uniref:Glycosyltransferase RgtA/B/C/D-like domain-containing protein n=1 Tax=Salinicola rhizosphaerae TaxID=1443141 RepID=A0ABQ3E5P3_9GAMM|nr:glycosyltransferase family 39 protein [Salinicola rhizosphaerae]GHB27070.1 hypothetical protein GCM10009038_27180 [Salinicola rhizosphaerae]
MIANHTVFHRLRAHAWDERHRDLLVVLLLWSMMMTGALIRPLLPIDETRYVSVAWEMWQAHHAFLPSMNGSPYADKPPLLFWLIHAGWVLFGVNDWWPKLISPLASLVAVAHLYRIARRLGYAGSRARVAPMVLMSMLLWSLYSGALMFDVLLTACLLGAIATLIKGAFTRARALHFGIWLGLALLAKGPVALVTLTPIVLTTPWWRETPLTMPEWRRLAAALGLSLSLLLGWALTAAYLGGAEFARDLLWGQSIDRLHDSMAHARPLWWYLPWLPLLLFPWSLWVTAKPTLPRHRYQRLAWAWTLLPLLIFSLISGKQIHYLMPLLPGAALIVTDRLGQLALRVSARPRLVPLAIAMLGLAGLGLVLMGIGAIDRTTLSPFGALVLIGCAVVLWRQPARCAIDTARTVAIGSGIALMITTQLMLAPFWQHDDIARPARLIAALQQEGTPVAFDGANYQATFQFAGRLTKPLIPLADDTALCRFRRQMPEGWIVGRARHLNAWITSRGHVHTFDYRGGKLEIMPVSELSLAGVRPSCR